MSDPIHSAPSDPPAPQAGRFPTTHWTSVINAAFEDSATGLPELNRLCQNYWPAIYAFVRHQKHSVDEAEDLTQEFFRHLLEKRRLETVDRERGRFRTFLLAALKNFLNDEWRRAHRKKRGGDYAFVSLESLDLEGEYQDFQSDRVTPEALYEQAWARALLRRVFKALEDEFRRAGRSDQFKELKAFLENDWAADSYAEVSKRLGMSESAVRSAIYRLRQRYARTLKEEVERLVGDPGDVDGEIRHLVSRLRLTQGSSD